MKKIIYIIITFMLFPTIAFANNEIYNMDVNIYLNKDGSANITENWDVKGSDGTEWYKAIYDLDDDQLSNFKVKMDGNDLTYKNWNVDESLSQKKGYYGINYTSNSEELCFGKYDYDRHTFTLTYTLKDYITNTSDAQVLYWTIIGSLSNVTFDNFSITVSGYYSFPDTLDVWGYGYKGYAYVSNGKISMSNEENTSVGDSYVVLLAKFPLNTFEATKDFPDVDNFDDIYSMAEEGTYEYNYGGNIDNGSFNFDAFKVCIEFMIAFIVILVGVSKVSATKYGYKDNKVINKKNTPMYREIPCNKDIHYANVLCYLNNFNYKETNIFGAIILKWVKENKIKFINEKTGIFNVETTSIDLTLNPSIEDEDEWRLFCYMSKASKDGILQSKELEKYCRSNYDEFLDVFSALKDKRMAELQRSGDIYTRTNKAECKCTNVLSDKIYNDSKELYGLKLYLQEFAQMNTKEVMEVKLWNEYLMFAYLFGIADKVAKQLKNLYPEVLSDPNINYDYDTLVFINHISSSTVSAASAARSAAQSYSSGGGGFSSGGGGGGSFGGGGFSSGGGSR